MDVLALAGLLVRPEPRDREPLSSTSVLGFCLRVLSELLQQQARTRTVAGSTKTV